MSHLPLRSEKKCLNCGAEVQDRFCPKCGQENVDVRPSFHHLISHFFADLFHYDSGFWKTMKTLLFKPGRIIRDYLDGKRKTYVPPVKLYIFVSFITFFIPFILPNSSPDNKGSENDKFAYFEGIDVKGYENIKTVSELDSIQNLLPENEKIDSLELQFIKLALQNVSNSADMNVESIQLGESFKFDFGESNERGYSFGEKYKEIKSVAQFDSIHNGLSPENRMYKFFTPFARKIVELYERGLYENHVQISEQFKNYFVQNLPKVLFIYLPFFAFFLWLFHSKKKWLYYDHGIFTLYFMSALLIFITLNTLIHSLISIPAIWWSSYESVYNVISVLIGILIFGYSIFYLFRAHHVVYEKLAWRSRLVVLILLLVNMFMIFWVGVFYTIFTFMLI